MGCSSLFAIQKILLLPSFELDSLFLHLSQRIELFFSEKSLVDFTNYNYVKYITVFSC